MILLQILSFDLLIKKIIVCVTYNFLGLDIYRNLKKGPLSTYPKNASNKTLTYS